MAHPSDKSAEQQIIDAVNSGATEDQIQALIASIQEGQEWTTRGDEILAAVRAEVTPQQYDLVHKARMAAAMYGAEEDPGVMSFLFGDPDSTIQTGVAPIPGGGSIKGITEAGEEVITQIPKLANPFLASIARALVKATVPRSAKGLLVRGGIAGLAAAQIFGEAPPGGPTNQAGGFPAASPTGEVEDNVSRTQRAMLQGAQATRMANLFNRDEGPENVSLGTAQQLLLEGGLSPSTPKKGFNVLVVDHDGALTGTPGGIAVINPQEMGINPDVGMSSLLDINGAPIATGDIAELIATLPNAGGTAPGVGPGASTQVSVFQSLFPEGVGTVGINRPLQVGRTLGDIMAGMRAPTADPRDLESRAEVARANATRTPVDVPAGAELSPRTFGNYGGRTLLEWAGAAAKQYGVPLNVLYGVIDHESGWKTDAIGDNGNSHGLAQIYMPVWGGQVSIAQARDPRFALNWTARMLAERFRQFGTWQAAVAAHNSPVAAEYLARTGKFQNQKSALYVGDVFDRASRSGLGNTILDDISTTEINEPGSGASFTPFQKPDPAATRQFVRETYQAALGRKPTEQELRAGANRINALSRMAYNANLTQAKGGESEAVDPGARFTEELTQSGEGMFQEEVIEYDSFTDHVAGLARMMQQGL